MLCLADLFECHSRIMSHLQHLVEVHPRQNKNLRFHRVLLCPADKAVFVRLLVAGEAVDFRVGSQ